MRWIPGECSLDDEADLRPSAGVAGAIEKGTGTMTTDDLCFTPATRLRALIQRKQVSPRPSGIAVAPDRKPGKTGGSVSQDRKMLLSSVDVERHAQRLFQFGELPCRQGSHEVRQGRLGQADELVAVDAALVLESLAGAHRDLGGQPLARRVDRGADHRRKPRLEHGLSTHHHEDP